MKKYRIAALLLLLALLCTGCSIGDQETIAALRESDELWISYGLAAWENNVKEEDISYIFYDNEASKYLSLFDHMFTYDAELSIPVAEQFFRFVAEEYGLKAILNTELRRDYKNLFLRKMNFKYNYYVGGLYENFFRELDYESNDDYKYIFSNENFRISIADLEENIADLEAELCKVEVATDHMRLAAISGELEEKREALEEKYDLWLELQC